MESVEQSLSRLQVECIDLYQSHWDDETTPQEETLEAYARLMQQGKVKAIGASNLSAARLESALKASASRGLPRYETLQPPYNLVDRATFEGPLAQLCVREEIGVITYFALAAGFLSGKYRSEADFSKSARGPGMKKYLDARGLRILGALDDVARGHRVTPAQVALAWLISRPAVTAPIASATSLAQLDELIAATRLELDPQALAALDRASA
jgi:aryl-alcohol dehydrogenase-like predicted oxidoreductase